MTSRCGQCLFWQRGAGKLTEALACLSADSVWQGGIAAADMVPRGRSNWREWGNAQLAHLLASSLGSALALQTYHAASRRLHHRQAAYALTRDARAYLHGMADDVARQIKVVGCTRRKQRAMAALEVAAKVKKAKDLQGMLKYAPGWGEGGEREGGEKARCS